MGEYKFNVRNTANDGWVNVLTDINVDLDPSGVAASQFASSVLDEVLVELKGLTGGGGPGYAGEPVHIVNTLDVVNSTDETGSFSTRGGVAIAKSVFIGNTLTVELVTDATAITDGALNVAGGVGIQKSLFVGGVTNLTDTTITNVPTGNSLNVDGSIGTLGGVNIPVAAQIYHGDDPDGNWGGEAGKAVQSLIHGVDSDGTDGGFYFMKTEDLGFAVFSEINATVDVNSCKIHTSSHGNVGQHGKVDINSSQSGADILIQNTDSGVTSYMALDVTGASPYVEMIHGINGFYIIDMVPGVTGDAVHFQPNTVMTTGSVLNVDNGDGANLFDVTGQQVQSHLPLQCDVELLVDGFINCNDVTGSNNNPATGSIVTAGGLGVAENVSVGGIIYGAVEATTFITTTVDSNLVPSSGFNLGSVGNEWGNVYATNIESSVATITTLNATTINSATFTGNFNGDFNGNLSGDVAGDVTGNLNGDLIAPITNATEIVTTGDLTIGNDGFVTGDLTVTGTIIGGGIGGGPAWTAIPSHIIPDTLGAYDIGAPLLWWRNIYSTHFITTNADATLSVPLTITSTTNATDKDTGALIVEGGVGIEKDLHVGGTIFLNGTIDADFSGTFTGDVIGDVTGDLNGDLIKGTTVYLNNPTPATTLGTGALVISSGTIGPTGAGLSVEGNLFVGGTIYGSGGGGGGTPLWYIANEGQIVESGKYYFVGTGVVNLTLPATPVINDTIKFKDFDGTWFTNNCIVDPNGNDVEGSANNLVLNVANAVVELVYTTEQGWKII